MTAPAPNPGILDIQPYQGGKSVVAGVSRVIKLSSNEGALGTSPLALGAYRAASEKLHRYPDGGATVLRETLGAVHGLDPDRIVCGAGSDELIGLMVHAYCEKGAEVLYSAHGFLMYAIYARAFGAVPVAAPETDLTASVDALLARVTERTRIVFVANPNNPTGTYLPTRELARLRAGLPDDVLLVIDAAYAEYVVADDYEAGAALVDGAGENVVMTRTFSKIHGMGALRLGWAYCPAPVADVLNRVRSPFNVNAAAQAAGVAATRDVDFVASVRDHTIRLRDWTTERVRALGLTTTPSQANFVLIHFGEDGDKSAAKAAAFLEKRGIIVRAMGGYGLPGHLRVTIGLESEMEAFILALTAFMEA